MLLYFSGRFEHFPVKLRKVNIMKKLTIKDIAKMAEVSHTTLSRARNGAQCLYF